MSKFSIKDIIVVYLDIIIQYRRLVNPMVSSFKKNVTIEIINRVKFLDDDGAAVDIKILLSLSLSVTST